MRSRACLLSFTIVASLAGCARDAAAQASDPDVEQGRRLYMNNGCYACHGTVGQGGERSGGPRLAPTPYPFEAFRAIVRNPPEAMPRFDAMHVSDEQLRAIHRYLGSIAKGPGAKELPLLQGPSR